MTHCLIVDDSDIVRKTLRRMTEEHGFSCTEAENGETAYDACRGMMPDLIFLDWNMPVMNGLDFIKKLRKTAGGDKPKVIFCTSETSAKQIRRAMDAGADEYIMKPFDAGIVESKLRIVGVLGAY